MNALAKILKVPHVSEWFTAVEAQRIGWHHLLLSDVSKTVLHMIWNMSCPSAPPAIRDWTQTASGWNRWGRMEMEPSTGTSMVLVCTKRSRSRGKQRRAGRWPLFSAQSTKKYCQVTGSVCVVWLKHMLSVWLYFDMFLQVCFNYSSLSLLITLVKKL